MNSVSPVIMRAKHIGIEKPPVNPGVTSSATLVIATFAIHPGRSVIKPSPVRTSESVNGSQRSLRAPTPARKNIVKARYPMVGR